ncbi:hypothetical protein JTB14_034911 [Gonioctena quinquepunctata]|nr:hypothetical protein JTB14_034911 [Gonioctena quinquepunctata]
MSASDLATKIRRNQLSSEEVCKAYIDRIKEVNPFLNAVVEDRFQMAMKDARDVDEYLVKSGLNEEELKKTKPLLGVPLTVKESCGVEGLENSVGYLPRKGVKAESDGEVVRRLRNSGAIPLLVSNTPELCMGIESSNFISGTTNNPYDTTRTSGGSSGGEGALLGAGASVIGIGSDVGGSIRIPAMYNGVFGHKPSARLVSIKGHIPFGDIENLQDALVIGPITRYAQDLKLMMTVMVEPEQKNKLRLDEKVDLSKLNVFFMKDSGNCLVSNVQDEIKQAVVTATEYLGENCGSTIIRNKKFPVKDAITVCNKVLFTSIKDLPTPIGADDYIPLELLKGLFGYSKFTTNMTNILMQKKIFDVLVDDHSKEAASYVKFFVETLGDNGVFLYPTFDASASKHGEHMLTFPFTSYTVLANGLNLPATNIPCEFDKKGMPIGIQVIAAPNQDRLCLAVAEELEKCFGGWKPSR